MGQSPNSINYTNNPNDPILVQGNADMKNGTVSPRVWTTQITKTAQSGDFILSVRAPVGDVGKTDYDVVLGRGVAGIHGTEFIYQILIKMKLFNYWGKLATGSTFESINSNDIQNAEINIPMDLNEQKYIGDFLKSVDDLIHLQTEQLSLYESLKNYLLQSLFPSRGEFTPKVRFTDFKNAWQKSRAEYLFHPIAKKGFKDLPVLSVTQENGIIKRSDLSIDIKYNKSSLSNYKLVEPSNFVISLRSFQGGFELSNTSGIVSPAYTVFSFKEKTDNSDLFWKEKFKSYGFIQSLKAITFGIRDGKSISFSEFKSMSLTYTQNRIEQDKIGNILMSIDNLISKQRIEINYLEKMKNYYLQKLFI